MLRRPDPGLPVWHAGRLRPLAGCRIPIDSPTVLAGCGAFETVAVRAGVPLEWAEHVERLRRGVERLDGSPIDAVALEAGIAALAERLGNDGWLKVVWTPDQGLFAFGGTGERAVSGDAVATVRAATLPWPRPRRGPFVGCKLTNWAEAIAGRREAERRGADEGLWLDDRGHVAEACTANLCVIDRGALRTPPVSAAVLPGVVRRRVLELASALGLETLESPVRPERLRRAREAFLTSSVQGIRGLVEWDGRPIGDGTAGPWTRRLSEALDAARDEDVGTRTT